MRMRCFTCRKQVEVVVTKGGLYCSACGKLLKVRKP